MTHGFPNDNIKSQEFCSIHHYDVILDAAKTFHRKTTCKFYWKTKGKNSKNFNINKYNELITQSIKSQRPIIITVEAMQQRIHWLSHYWIDVDDNTKDHRSTHTFVCIYKYMVVYTLLAYLNAALDENLRPNKTQEKKKQLEKGCSWRHVAHNYLWRRRNAAAQRTLLYQFIQSWFSKFKPHKLLQSQIMFWALLLFDIFILGLYRLKWMRRLLQQMYCTALDLSELNRNELFRWCCWLVWTQCLLQTADRVCALVTPSAAKHHTFCWTN